MELGPTTALTGALEGLLVVDRAGHFTYANPAAERILGLPATKIVESSCQDWKTTAVDGEPFPVEELPVLRLLRTGEPATRAEHRLERADGTEAILSHTATLIRDDAGSVEGAVISLVDVTERRRAADRVRAAELSFLAFIDRSPNGIALHRKGRVVYANAGMCRTLGYADKDELVGREVLDFVHPDDRSAVAARIRDLTEEHHGVPPAAERLIHRDGTAIDVEVSAMPVLFEGEPTIVAIVADVSEQKRIQRELDRSISLLRATLESTADGILVVDDAGQIRAFNEKFLEMWRIPRSVIEGRRDATAITHVLHQLKDPAGFVARMRELYAEPETVSHDVIELADGRCFERYSQAQRIGGQCVGRVWSFRDVTARKHGELERERLLAEIDVKRRLLQTVIDHAPVGIALRRGPELVYDLVNAEFEATFGPQARLGRPFADVAPRTAPELTPILHRVLTTGEPYRARDVRHDVRRSENGPVEEAYFWLHYLRVATPKGDAVLALVVDTTEQVKVRRQVEELATVAQRQAAALESIHASMVDGIVVCAANGRITLVNDAAVRMTGVPRESVLDRSIEDYAKLLDLRNADGSPVSAVELPLARALAGQTVISEPLSSERTGRKIYVRTNATPLKNDRGEIIGAVAVERDVSDVIQFDLSKDQFVRVAAHELKTPIAIMKGYAQLLLRSGGELPAPLVGSLVAIERGANRIDRLVNDLLDLSQLQLGAMEIRSETVDLVALVDVVTRRAAQSTKRHRIRVLEVASVVVRGDRARLEQVLGNLIDNAIRYSPRGGDIEVTAVMHDDAVEVSVRDRGVGIPFVKQERVFQRFYRPHTDTPYDYGGMGVGLYISREIVERHGGSMWFESKEGSGSVFSFRLPV